MTCIIDIPHDVWMNANFCPCTVRMLRATCKAMHQIPLPSFYLSAEWRVFQKSCQRMLAFIIHSKRIPASLRKVTASRYKRLPTFVHNRILCNRDKFGTIIRS